MEETKDIYKKNTTDFIPGILLGFGVAVLMGIMAWQHFMSGDNGLLAIMLVFFSLGCFIAAGSTQGLIKHLREKKMQ